MTYERLSLPLEIDFPDEWYESSTADHFWFAWRVRVFKQLLLDNNVSIKANLPIMDIGSGTGLLRHEIESITDWTVDGVDLNESALEKSIPSRGRTLLYNIEDRRQDLKEHYDAIVLFDVLEHISDPGKFIEAALWHLKPGGLLLINVPALQILYSRYDSLVGHFRRYTSKQLQQFFTLHHLDFKPSNIRYWGMSLTAVAWVRKIALSGIRSPRLAILVGFNSPARWINAVFKIIMKTETRFLKHPPFGSSVMALATKPL